MKKLLIDLTGKKINMLTPLYHLPSEKGKHIRWVCKCDCGNEFTALSAHLRNNKITSCGCHRKQKRLSSKYNRIYTIWWKINNRCNNEKDPAYNNYGGRGITVCKEWKNSFETFLNWCLENNCKNGLDIDRIENEEGYYPSNCRFVSREENSNNRRTNVLIEYKGETKTLIQWSRVFNLDRRLISRRLKDGWTIEETFSIKPNIHNKIKSIRNDS